MFATLVQRALQRHPRSIQLVIKSDEMVSAMKGRQKAALWGEKQFNEKLRNVIERILSEHQID
jgi:hypothetical protein